jgi:hypothetical protein
MEAYVLKYAVVRQPGPHLASFKITMQPEEPWLEGE